MIDHILRASIATIKMQYNTNGKYLIWIYRITDNLKEYKYVTISYVQYLTPQWIMTRTHNETAFFFKCNYNANVLNSKMMASIGQYKKLIVSFQKC